MAFNHEMETNNVCYETRLKWTINNVWNYPPRLASQPFSPVGLSEKWVILIYCHDDRWEMFIKSLDQTERFSIVKVEGHMRFVDPSTSTSFTRNLRGSVKHNESNEISSCGYPFNQYIRSELKLKGDVLIIEFDLLVTTSINKVTGENINLIETTPSIDRDSTVLEKIYKENSYTDVVFSFDKNTIRAHKAVLAIVSPVFEKMFKHDTLENQTNSIFIKDVDNNVFQSLLEFIYTGKVSKDIKSDFDSVLALYEVSDKYEVGDLQKNCANILLSNFLNVERVCKILIIADFHSDASLKENLFKFLKEQFSEVVKTKEWSSLTSENIKLASEVVAFITNQIN